MESSLPGDGDERLKLLKDRKGREACFRREMDMIGMEGGAEEMFLAHFENFKERETTNHRLYHFLSMVRSMIKELTCDSSVDWMEKVIHRGFSWEYFMVHLSTIHSLTELEIVSLKRLVIGCAIDTIRHITADWDGLVYKDILALVKNTKFYSPLEVEHFHTFHQLFNMKLLKLHTLLIPLLPDRLDHVEIKRGIVDTHRSISELYFRDWPVFSQEEDHLTCSFITTDGLPFGLEKMKFLCVKSCLLDCLYIDPFLLSFASWIDLMSGHEDVLDSMRKDFLFQLQDDDLVELLHDLTWAYSKSSARREVFPIDVHYLFYHFLIHLEFDRCMVVDWMMSGDTIILEYLTRYLKILCVEREQALNAWGKILGEESKEIGELICSRIASFLCELTSTLTVLTKEGIFPYPLVPFMKLLDRVQLALTTTRGYSTQTGP